MSDRGAIRTVLGIALAAVLGCAALAASPPVAETATIAAGTVLGLATDAARTPADHTARLQHVQGGGRAVGPGTRLMYYASSASLAPGGNPDAPSAAGEGYTQVDVLYLDDQVCVVRLTNHLRDLTTGAVVGMGANGAVSRDGCADYWMPPERLVDLLGAQNPDVQVLRGQYPLGDQTFDAVYLATTAGGARYHASYDALSGLLLVHSGPVQDPTSPTTPAGGNLVTYGQIVGTMTMATVPAPTPLPDAVAQVSGLTYACNVTLSYPGTPPVQIPCQQDYEVVERAPFWLRLRVVRRTASHMGPIPTVDEAQEVLTAGGYGGVYASIAWLRGLAPGMVLEDDTITGVRAQVERADGSAVVVVATAATQRMTYVYDPQSGWLTRLVVEQQTGPSTSVQQLDLQQVR